MALATINIDALTALNAAMESAIDELPWDAYGMRSVLSPVDVDSSPSSGYTDVVSWAYDTLPGLKRRLALAISIEAQRPSLSATVQIDESAISTLTVAQAQAAGTADAKALASGSKLNPALLARIAANKNDPYYAQAFAQSITPIQLAQAVENASRARDEILRDQMYLTPEDYKKQIADWSTNYATLLDAAGSTIATATRGTGSLALPSNYVKTWSDAIDAGGYDDVRPAPPGQAAALSLLLAHGSYGKDFALTLSTDVYNYEQEQSKGGPVWDHRSYVNSTFDGVYGSDGTPITDPMGGVLTMLGSNPDAAQSFFTSGGDKTVKIQGHDVSVNSRLAYLTTDRTWAHGRGSDEGAGLGHAIDAATTFYRNSQASGVISATIASQTLALIGQKTKDDDGWKMYTALRPAIANVLADYMPDIFRIEGIHDEKADDLTKGWTATDYPGFPPGLPTGAALDPELLKTILGTLGEKQSDIQIVTAGAAAVQQRLFSYALADQLQKNPNAARELITGVNLPTLANASFRGSGVLGWIVNSAYQGAESNQEAQKKRAELIAKTLSTLTSLPGLEVPGGEWAQFAFDQVKDAAIEKIGEGPDGDVNGQYNEMDDTTKKSLENSVMSQLAATGYLDPKYVAAANKQTGNNYQPIPLDAYKGQLVAGQWVPNRPLTLDFDSAAYRAWDSTGNPYQTFLTNTVDTAYNDAYPNH